MGGCRDGCAREIRRVTHRGPSPQKEHDMTISKAIAEKLATALVRHRFAAEVEAIRDAEAALTMEAYNWRWSESDRAMMAAVPDGWLDTIAKIEVRQRFGVGLLHTGGGRYFEYMPPRGCGSVAWPQGRQYGKDRITITDEALSAKVEAHAVAVDKLSEAIKAAHRDASRTIAAMPSLKRLVEAWPEIQPFATPFMDVKPNTLPALRTADL